MSALNTQTGGNHYKNFVIQPIEYTMKNGLGFIEGNIIKYVSRHKLKNGAEDIQKVKHYAELLLELEYGIKPPRVVVEKTAEEMIEDAFKKVVDEPATPEERSARALIEMVMNNKHRCIILKGITNRFISEGADSVDDFETNINEAVINHPNTQDVSGLLDILLKD